MITFKRNTPTIDTTLANTSKYLNQMQFTGITEENNLFVTDQQSARDAVNVYTDIDGHFVSRPTLQKDKTIDKTVNDLIENYNHKLVELYSIGIGKVYITINTNDLYSAIVVTETGATYELNDLPKYRISIIEHYVICFNNKENVGAQVFDTNEPSKGWQSFNKFIDIPITKRIIGNQETLYDKNEFTDSHEEQYIWSVNSKPTLPNGNPAVKVKTQNAVLDWGSINDMNIYTDYRTIKNLSIPVGKDALITSSKNRICIAYSDYFEYSLNNGETFTKAYYPVYQGKFLNIASISKDGQYFFFVTSYGVYRCKLGDLTWAFPVRAYKSDNTTIEDIQYEGINNSCYFMTGDIFSFYTYNSATNTARIYYLGPGLYSGNAPKIGDDGLPIYQLNYTELFNIYFGTTTTDKDYAKNQLYMYLTTSLEGNVEIATLFALAIDANDTAHSYYLFQRGEEANKFVDTSGGTNNFTIIDSLNYRYISLSSVYDIAKGTEKGLLNSKLKIGFNFTGAVDLGYQWKIIESTIEFKVLSGTSSINPVYTEITNNTTAAQCTVDGLIYNLFEAQLVSDSLDVNLVYTYNDIKYSDLLPDLIVNGSGIDVWKNRRAIWVDGDTYYIVTENGTIYTNNLSTNDLVEITYRYTSNNVFLDVPQLSYSDTELYLAFNNTLRITSNNRKGVNILFNLPKINDQSFIEPITGLINISTTEVAVFFENKIVVCSKQSDELLGFRYDYYNTKLSTGIRLGDSVINTLEGAYTIFPTKRGLAIMNYQAFMATTDQVITYITDVIKTLWNKFFDNSTVIKIIQWRNILVFTNNTKEILLYDLDTKAWWRWEVPLNCQIALSDQIKLQLIKDTLLVFEDAPRYYDFSKTNTLSNGAKVINWYYQSQPLHFSAPNHYKNLKQLVFQFYEDNDISTTKTMLAQIKLYRKRITQRAPETIKFKIEEYRTFVKRFNYWKINELQWALANDIDTSSPMPLKLNGINIKYEIGEEVK